MVSISEIKDSSSTIPKEVFEKNPHVEEIAQTNLN
jgi:hypothetical protein